MLKELSYKIQTVLFFIQTQNVIYSAITIFLDKIGLTVTFRWSSIFSW